MAILKKMTASTDRKFPWKRGSILLLLLIGTILIYDCQKHGSFEASNTGKLLKNSGITAQALKIWSMTEVYTSKITKTIEDSSPEYYKAAVNFSTPYIKLGKDLYIVTRNLSIRLYNNAAAHVEKHGPMVHETIEHYFPGMIEQIQKQSIQGFQLAKNYSIIAGEKLIETFDFASHWLRTNVFVGDLSPENLQNYANRAIDVTQTYASQTYHWVYEKMQSLSKVS